VFAEGFVAQVVMLHVTSNGELNGIQGVMGIFCPVSYYYRGSLLDCSQY